MQQCYDISIVGGGMVGATLALALAQLTPFSIALFDKMPFHALWKPSDHDPRVSALSLSSQRIFKTLGIWDSMLHKRVSPFTGMGVWEANSRGYIQFNCAELSENELGFVVENNLICSVLYQNLQQYPKVSLLPATSLSAVQIFDHEAVLTTAKQTAIHTQLIIAADGMHSWVRRAVGIPLRRYDYAKQALVTIVRTTCPHQQQARQIFYDRSILALLPLVDQTAMNSVASRLVAIIWSLERRQAQAKLALPIDQFNLALNQVLNMTADECGQVESTIEQRYLYPLYSQQAQSYIRPRVILVGDAAHTMHPLAGQGVNLGLLDAACLVELLQAQRKKKHFYQLSMLRQYERWRKAENLMMLFGVHGLQMCFASTSFYVKSLRSFGMRTINKMAWLKARFMRYAAGNRLKSISWIKRSP